MKSTDEWLPVHNCEKQWEENEYRSGAEPPWNQTDGTMYCKACNKNLPAVVVVERGRLEEMLQAFREYCKGCVLAMPCGEELRCWAVKCAIKTLEEVLQ